MTEAFVWFHHNSADRNESTEFYQRLLGWSCSQGPGDMAMLAAERGPFAATGERYGDAPGWIPFVEVCNVDAATEQALALGATLVRGKSRGPAGEFAVVRDPSGAAIGLWQRA